MKFVKNFPLENNPLYGILCTYVNDVFTFYSQEGPHSVMNEEEYFDALEIAYHDNEMLSVS